MKTNFEPWLDEALPEDYLWTCVIGQFEERN